MPNTNDHAALSPAMSRLLERLGRLQASSAILIALGTMLSAWRLLLLPQSGPAQVGTLAGAAVSLVLQLAMINGFAKWFGRIPKRNVRVDIGNQHELERQASILGVKPPRLVIDLASRGPSVRLRGWGQDIAIVASSWSKALWEGSARTYAVQTAHELGHLRSGDLSLYYRVRAFGTVSLTELFIMAIGTSLKSGRLGDYGQMFVKLAVVFLLTFLIMRSYLRYREHAADLTAMVVVGDYETTRQEIANITDQTKIARFVGTHPSRQRRLGVLLDPTTLAPLTLWSYLALGLAAGYFASTTEGLLRGMIAPWPSRWLAVAGVSIAMTCLVADPLIKQSELLPATRRRTVVRLIGLFVGLAAGFALLDPFVLVGRGVHVNLIDALLVGTSAACIALLVGLTSVAAGRTSVDGFPTDALLVAVRLSTLQGTSAIFVLVNNRMFA